MDEERRKENNSRYRVIDKRGVFSEDKSDSVQTQPLQQEQCRESGSASSSGSGGDAGADADVVSHKLGIEDAIRYSLNVIREQVFFALGLVISGNRATEPDFERTRQVVEIFSKLTDRFAGQLASQSPEESESRLPSLEDSIVFCFNLIQSQVFMYLGLIADPATGQVRKDIEQAKTGVDFAAAMLEAVRPVTAPSTLRLLEGLVADLKINFVRNK